jgi:iron-sulfur cluster repair protein YtfE (RIC family)
MSSCFDPRAVIDRLVAHHHDYVWARLPLVVPMAITAARRRGDRTSHELACLIVELRPLLLDHLEREERLVVDHETAALGMHADHVAVTAMLDHIRDVTGPAFDPGNGADPTERALYVELARLDHHVQAQITLEEHVMAWQSRA